MGSPGTGHGRRVGVLPGSVFLVRVFFHLFFFCHEKCYTVAKKGFVTVVITQYFVCPHSLLNLLFSGFTYHSRAVGRGKEHVGFILHICRCCIFDGLGLRCWDYAERMLYFLLGCSLWIKAFWCLLSSYSPYVHALKLGTQSL